MRRESLLLLGLLTTICLIVGVVVGIKSGKFVTGAPRASATASRGSQASLSTQSSTPSPAPNLQPTLPAPQMALLIIGVGDRNALLPKFEGCWIIAFSPGITRYYVLGFPPEARFRLNRLGTDQTLADIYTQGVQQELGYVFIRDAIQSVFTAMTVQAVVTLDRSDVANLTSNLGGVTVDGQLLMGGSLTAAYDTQSFNGAGARMDFQRQTIQGLFQDLAEQHWSPATVAAYLQELPHAVRLEDKVALLDMANRAPALQNSELTWTVVGGVHETATVP